MSGASAAFDGSAALSFATTLANSGVTAGTYTKVTVDTKGRVTTGASLASSDVTGALGFTPANKAGESFTGSISVSGTITATGDITAYSDETLKSDIRTISGALDLVASMRGVTFTRIDTGLRGVGVVAQELAAVIPEAVQANDGGLLSVAYGNLVGVLIEAVKDLAGKVERLEPTQPSRYRQGQALPAGLVDDRQDAELAAIVRAPLDKVVRPHVPRILWPQADT